MPEESKPQLVIANADLPDLFLTRKEELKRYFDIACAQATNQFRDAVSFVIVPNVAEFRRKRPAKKKKSSAITLDDPLVAMVKAAQDNSLGDSEGYGRVTFVDEMLDLMDWGREYFFQVLFSPEERVRAGRVQRDFFSGLADAYAIETVVDSPSADCAIMCLPDFNIMPPDGKLVTGKTSNGEIEVGVDVPELTVRSCYVAAGRLMSNDVPAYLRRKLQRASKDPTGMRMDLPGVGIDLSVHPYLGETHLPTDHFLNDGVLANLLADDMPFTVFTHVRGRSPFLSVPRTMKRMIRNDGSSTYSHLHLFRQQAYLSRLLRAAHELGYAGSLPSNNDEAEAFISGFISYILNWTGWYAPEKLVNSFPSRLREEEPFKVNREVGNSFNVTFNFEQGMIGELVVKF